MANLHYNGFAYNGDEELDGDATDDLNEGDGPLITEEDEVDEFPDEKEDNNY